MSTSPAHSKYMVNNTLGQDKTFLMENNFKVTKKPKNLTGK
jgi:hypothetical protein